MKKPIRLTLLIIVALMVAGGVSVKLMLDHGFSARDTPTSMEKLVARFFRDLAIPSAFREAKNPVRRTPEVITAARAHFADHCSFCHGNDGRGKTTIGQNLYPKAPDIWLVDTQHLTDGQLFYIIKNGVRLTGMPAWGENTPQDDRQSWELVHFIRHLPRITPEEIFQMEALNPRSREEWEEAEAARRFLAGEDIPSTPVPSKPRQQ